MISLLQPKQKIMEIEFQKYQGTGNDFVMIDNRNLHFPKNNEQFIEKLCNRRFGIGADGLILLENHSSTDFQMVYYNSDGKQSSMCGNGGRCIVNFAKSLNIIKNETTFMAIDGSHYATIDAEDIVSLQMKNVENIKITDDYVFLDTGSPHHIVHAENLDLLDVKTAGSSIRYSDLYGEKGSNINFVSQISHDTFAIRTYERGVEDETLSCGTGATAVAIAMKATGKTNANHVNIQVQGGNLAVYFTTINGQFKNVFLKGDAQYIYKGVISI